MKKHILKSKGVSVALSTIVMMQTLLFSTAFVNADSEQIEAFVDRCYEVCLDRDPDPNGRMYWAQELEEKNISGSYVAAGFIFSREYEFRNRTDEEFVKDLYRLLTCALVSFKENPVIIYNVCKCNRYHPGERRGKIFFQSDKV